MRIHRNVYENGNAKPLRMVPPLRAVVARSQEGIVSLSVNVNVSAIANATKITATVTEIRNGADTTTATAGAIVIAGHTTPIPIENLVMQIGTTAENATIPGTRLRTRTGSATGSGRETVVGITTGLRGTASTRRMTVDAITGADRMALARTTASGSESELVHSTARRMPARNVTAACMRTVRLRNGIKRYVSRLVYVSDWFLHMSPPRCSGCATAFLPKRRQLRSLPHLSSRLRVLRLPKRVRFEHCCVTDN